MEPKKITLTCDVCGEKKTEFCEVCQVSVVKEDGLLLNICSDCFQAVKRKKEKGKRKMETVDFVIKFSDEHRVPLNDVILILFFIIWVNYE